MAVDSTGQNELSGGVELFLARVERIPERGNAAVADAYVGRKAVRRGDHGPSPDDEIESAHARVVPSCPAAMAAQQAVPVLMVKPPPRGAAACLACARRP